MDFPMGHGGEICQLPTPMTEAEADGLCQDDNWVAEPKKDGVHVLVVRRNDAAIPVRAFSRKANIRGVAPALAEPLLQFAPPTILDAEEMHVVELVVFDLLQFEGDDLRAAPYGERYRIAEEKVLPRLIGSPVSLIPMVRGTSAKRNFIQQMRAAGEEGVIFRDLRAFYTPGRPSGGGVYTSRKLKFLKDVDVIIGRREGDTTRSFEMFCLDGTDIVNVGSVSARHFFEKLQPGATTVATVKYLYATPERKLYQPVLVRFRDDKTPIECGIEQLQLGGRFAGQGGQ